MWSSELTHVEILWFGHSVVIFQVQSRQNYISSKAAQLISGLFSRTIFSLSSSLRLSYCALRLASFCFQTEKFSVQENSGEIVKLVHRNQENWGLQRITDLGSGITLIEEEVEKMMNLQRQIGKILCCLMKTCWLVETTPTHFCLFIFLNF